MAFQESFVQCMQNAGVQVNQSAVSDPQHFREALDYVKQWFDGLDQMTQEALDAATTNDQASYLLADANVAPGLQDLLSDFDNAQGWPLSTLVQWSVHCIGEAEQAGAGAAAQ